MLAVMLLVGAGVSGARAASDLPWWDRSWPYRKIVDIPAEKQRWPDSNAAALWVHTGGRGRPDGADIRVIGPKGSPLPFGIVHSTPEGKHLVVFQAPQKRGAYAIYFGKLNAPKPKYVIPPLGLLLDTMPIPKGTNWNNLQSVKQAIERSSDLYGRDYWPNVFDGCNPFGPSRQYMSVYRGYIHCPSDGLYKFATLSDYSSFLLIDDRLVTEWKGSHNIHAGRRGQHSGQVRLKGGTHKFTYVSFAYSGRGRCAAAWIPPGEDWWKIIPQDAFPGPLKAKVVGCESVASAVCADFRCEPISYCESGEAKMVAVRFFSQSTAARGLVRAYKWEFGDGLSGRGAEPVHVYFAPGTYDVKLSVVSSTRATDTLVRKVRADPVWTDLDFRKPKLDRFQRWTRDYEVAKLPTRLLLGAWAFFTNTEQQVKAFNAAVELDRRRAELSPSELYEVAVFLGASYQERPKGEEQAEKYFELALRTAGDDTEKRFSARFHLAELYFSAMNQLDRALEAFRSLREDFPQADPVRRRKALIRIGDIYRNKGQLGKAKEVYLEAEQDPAYVPEQPRSILLGRYAHDVESYLLQGDGQAALDLIEEWLWDYPTEGLDGRPMLLRVKALLLLKNYPEAKKQAETYLGFASDPDYVPYLHVAAGEACIELGLTEAAREHFRVVMEDFPESPAVKDAQDGMSRL